MKLHHQLGLHLDHSPNSSRSFICPPTDRTARKYKNAGIDKALHIAPVADNKHASPKTFKIPFLRLNQQSPTSVQQDYLTSLDSKDRIPEVIMSPFPVQRFSTNGPQTPSSHRSRLEVNGFYIGYDDIKGDDYNLESQRTKISKGEIEAILTNMKDISIIAPHKQKAERQASCHSLDVPRTALDEMLEIPIDHFYKPEENKKLKKKPKPSIITFLDRKFPPRLAYRRKSCYCTCCGNRPKIQKDIENNPWVSLLTGWDEHKIAATYITRLYKPYDKESLGQKLSVSTANKKKRINIKRQTDGSRIDGKKPGSSRNNIDERKEGANKSRLSTIGLRTIMNFSAMKRNSKETQASQNESSVGRSTVIHSGSSSMVLDRYENGIDWYTSRKRYETPDSQQELEEDEKIDRVVIKQNTKLMSRKELSSLAHVEVSEREDSRSVSASSIKRLATVNNNNENQFKLKVLRTMNPKKDFNKLQRPVITQVTKTSRIRKEQVDGDNEVPSMKKVGEDGNNEHIGNRGRHIRKNEGTFLKNIIKAPEKNNVLIRKGTVPNLYTTKTEEDQKDDIIEDERGKSVNKDDRDAMRSKVLLKNFLIQRPAPSMGVSPLRFDGNKVVDSRESSCKRDEIKPKGKGKRKLKLKKLEDKKLKKDMMLEKRFREIYNLHARIKY